MTHHKYEQTFTLIKPDGIQRSLIGEMIGRFEKVGLKLVAMKMFVPTKDLIKKHYTIDPDWFMITGTKSIKGRAASGEDVTGLDPIKVCEEVLERLQTYLSAGPVISMVWQGAHAVRLVRKLVGGTEPLTSDVGTIRGDFVMDSYEMTEVDKRSIRNLIHASGSVKEAHDEINLWFKPEEIIKYRLAQEEILYDVNLDGILE